MEFDFRKYGFYLGLGGVVVLYIILYILLIPAKRKYIAPLNNLIDQQTAINKFLSPKNPLPNDELIKYHQKIQADLENYLNNVNTELIKRDIYLEQWFDDLQQNMKLQATTEPKIEEFQTVYSVKRTNLVNTYANKTEGLLLGQTAGSTVDDPKNRRMKIQSEILPPEMFQNPLSNPDLIKRAQKQFWIVEKILQVAEKGKLKRLHSYRFLGNWEDSNTKDFFIRRKIELIGQIEYGDIPIFIQEILNNPYFFTEISKISMRRDNNYRPEVVRLDVRYDQSEAKVLEEYLRKNPTKGRLPLVEVRVHVDILDYQEKVLMDLIHPKKAEE